MAASTTCSESGQESSGNRPQVPQTLLSLPTTNFHNNLPTNASPTLLKTGSKTSLDPILGTVTQKNGTVIFGRPQAVGIFPKVPRIDLSWSSLAKVQSPAFFSPWRDGGKCSLASFYHIRCALELYLMGKYMQVSFFVMDKKESPVLISWLFHILHIA